MKDAEQHVITSVEAPEGSRLERGRLCAAHLALVVVAGWCVHFARSASLGLHVEDYFLVADAMRLPDLGAVARHSVTMAGLEGRPLHLGFIYLFSFLGDRLAGLSGIYCFGFLLLASNAALLYALLLRVSREPSLALAAALAFVLFPADTTRNWLTMSLGGQPATTLILLALHLYLGQRFWASHLVAGLALLCYETSYLPFLAAPLLVAAATHAAPHRVVRHAVVMAAILLGCSALRAQLGDERALGLDPRFVAETLPTNMALGPVVSLTSYVYRPLLVVLRHEDTTNSAARFRLSEWDGPAAASLLACLALLGIALWRQTRVGGAAARRAAVRLLLSGLAMTILAYGLSLNPFNHDVSVVEGRDTRLHAGAAIGAAIVAATVFHGLQQGRWRTLVRALAVGLGLVLGAAGVQVQRDYALSWSIQQSFWQELISLVGRVERADLVLLATLRPLPDPGFVGTLDMIVPKLPWIYHFPADWRGRDIPAVHLVAMDRLRLSPEGKLVLDSWVVWRLEAERFGEYDPAQVILLTLESGRLQRVASLEVSGQVVELKASPRAGSVAPGAGPLYPYLIETPVEPFRY